MCGTGALPGLAGGSHAWLRGPHDRSRQCASKVAVSAESVPSEGRGQHVGGASMRGGDSTWAGPGCGRGQHAGRGQHVGGASTWAGPASVPAPPLGWHRAVPPCASLHLKFPLSEEHSYTGAELMLTRSHPQRPYFPMRSRVQVLRARASRHELGHTTQPPTWGFWHD